MPRIYIDNHPYEVRGGKNLLETCLTAGLDLPYFCWHPALGSVGACRQCAVKVFRDENDKKGRLIMSCMEPVADNQRISVADPEAVEFREGVIEWLMTNHPHDCAVCDEGGSCHLQDMTVMTGHAYRRYQFKKRTHRNQDLGPFINHEMNRCIACYRCVRFYKDYAGGKDLDVFASRSNVYFGRASDGALESEFSGNLAEVCPTGVFTDKTLKEHYTRKWDLTTAPSICQHCSLGCNTIAGERYGALRMISNRYNGAVNGYFLCDRGRFGYDFVNANSRIRVPLIDQKEVDRSEVLQRVASLVAGGKVVGIGSPRASLQSNFALKAVVGAGNFYHGVSDSEHDLAELAVKILKEGTARSASIRDVETSDAVLVLGEDLTNTAPMLALAVRQAARQKPMNDASAVAPRWNDAAIREIVQDGQGPVFIASLAETKLHDVATAVYHGTPDQIARLGFGIANRLDSSAPAVDLEPNEAALAKVIADALMKAERPLIISGTASESASVMNAASNVASALSKKKKNIGIAFTLQECNSLGLAMMGGNRLNDAFNAVINGHADTAIVMENDLFRHGKKARVDEFLRKCKCLIVLDHSTQETSKRAHISIPAGTFAESDGIVVNNEGRAQRFFQVYESTDVIQESWRWLLNIGIAAGNVRMKSWTNFQSITAAISQEEPMLAGIDKVTPAPDFRMAGQRIPRAPHRYSGRTAMLANVNVSEPKPPEDPDSGMSYTMEGYRGQPPSSMIPFFWSPGWNSVQSVNKYQEEVGASLRGGDPGVRLLEPSGSNAAYFTAPPEKFQPIDGHLFFVSLFHIYGSDELSALSAPVTGRIPAPYVMINNDDALALKIVPGGSLGFEIEGQSYSLPVRTSAFIRRGVAGLPYLGGLPYSKLPTWGTLKK